MSNIQKRLRREDFPKLVFVPSSMDEGEELENP